MEKQRQKDSKNTDSQKISAGDLSTEAVMTEYVDIVNKAIDRNSDSWPMGQVIKLGDKALDGNFGVAVYRDDADEPHDFFTLKFDDGRLRIVAHGKQNPKFTWKASEKYLRKVIANREQYVEKPAKLDFDWLKDRTGLN